MTTPDQYNRSVPQPDDTIADSQPAFLTNFQQLFNAFNRDHVNLSAATNAGNHNVARLFEQKDSKNTGVSDVALYSKGRKFQTNQLFFREQGNQQEIQYSNYQLFDVPNLSGQTSFFSFLPGNILVYFGRVNPNGFSFNLELNPVVCNNILSVNFCCINTSGRYIPIIGLEATPEGLINRLKLENSDNFTGQTTIPNLFYIIFGNPAI